MDDTVDDAIPFSDDDMFNPDDLLTSPLFHDPGSRMGESFGSFALDEDDDEPFNVNISSVVSSDNELNELVFESKDLEPEPLQANFNHQAPKRTLSTPLSQGEQATGEGILMASSQQQSEQQRHSGPSTGKTSDTSSSNNPQRTTPMRSVSFDEDPAGNNPFQMQQMQQQLNQVDNGGDLSQSMHTPFTTAAMSQSPGENLNSSLHSVQSRMAAQQQMNMNNMQLQQLRQQPMTGVQPVNASVQPVQSFAFQNNVSIARNELNGSKHGLHPTTGIATSGPGQPKPLNNAMEKLCESMKRSAMTRNLVKQISSRGVTRQGSARGMVVRQNSARGMLARQNSSRGGALVMGQGSSRRLMDDSSGRSAPIRRMSSMNAKHTLQHHGRGVFRHDSQQSLNNSAHGAMGLNIDGRNMGTF